MRSRKILMKEISQSRLGRLAYLFMAAPLLRLRRRMDYAEFGGAPLLGVNGVSVICHGRSSAKAIKNAIIRAHKLAEGGLIEQIRDDIAQGLMTASADSPSRKAGGMRSQILGTGAYVPDRVLTNGDLERMVATSDSWIMERTGIRETASRSSWPGLFGSRDRGVSTSPETCRGFGL